MAKKKAKSKPKKASKSKSRGAKKALKKSKPGRAKAVKRKAVKKAARPSAKLPVKSAAKPVVQRTKIGEVTHFYSHISVAVVRVESGFKVGDNISIEGATTNIKQKVDSMQMEHNNIQEAKKGQEIGMKVVDKVREGDIVYKA